MAGRAWAKCVKTFNVQVQNQKCAHLTHGACETPQSSTRLWGWEGETKAFYLLLFIIVVLTESQPVSIRNKTQSKCLRVQDQTEAPWFWDPDQAWVQQHYCQIAAKSQAMKERKWNTSETVAVVLISPGRAEWTEEDPSDPRQLPILKPLLSAINIVGAQHKRHHERVKTEAGTQWSLILPLLLMLHLIILNYIWYSIV